MGDIAIKGNRLTAAKGGRASLRFGGGRTDLLEELGRVEGERSNPNRRAEISRVHSELNRGYKDGGRIGFKDGNGVEHKVDPRGKKYAKSKKMGAAQGQVYDREKDKFIWPEKPKEKVVVDPSKRRRISLGDPKHRALYEDRSKRAEGGRIGFRSGTPKALEKAAKKKKIEQTKTVKRLTTSDKAYSPKKLLLQAFKKNKYDEGGTGTAKRITTWDNIRDEAKKLQTKLPGSRVSVEPLKNKIHRRGLGWKAASKTSRSPYSPPQPKQPLIAPWQAKIERRAEGGRIGFKKGTDKKWMQKVSASIKKRGTKGKCTPITKKGCTGRALALAKTFKKIAAKRKA